jgi:hypothetical protein
MVADPTRGAAAVSAATGAWPVEIWIVGACTSASPSAGTTTSTGPARAASAASDVAATVTR